MTWRDALLRARATGDRQLRNGVVRAARVDGVTCRAIAEVFDISTATVQAWAGGPLGRRSRPLDAPARLAPAYFDEPQEDRAA